MSKFCSFYDWVVFHCINIFHVFFIHSFVDWHLGCFHALTIVNNVAMDAGVHVSLQIHVLIFGYIARGGVAGSYGSSISFLRKLYTVFQFGCWEKKYFIFNFDWTKCFLYFYGITLTWAVVFWEDPEGWDGEGGGRGDRDGEHM